MARPLKDGLDYFPHDTDASNDEKLEALRAIHGNDGYAFYFILLERIYRTPNAELLIPDAETNQETHQETIQILSRKIAITTDKFAEILKTALNHNCFNKELYEKYHILTSNGIKKRAKSVIEKRVQMRLKYERDRVSDAEIDQETRNKPDKVKKSKVNNKLKYNKESNKEKYGKFQNVLLTLKEYNDLIENFNEVSTKERIEKLSEYMESKGKRYNSHYATILNWDRMDNKNNGNKPKEQGFEIDS